MAQASSLSPVGISAVKVLARLAAKKAVQAELRAQGVRVTLVRPAEISERAQVYLQAHPELYQLALERAKRMTAEGVFGKRAQRAYLSSAAQTKDTLNSMGSVVQMLGAK